MDQGLVKTAIASGLLREEWPEYRLVIPAEEPVSRQVKQLRSEWESVYGSASVSEKPPSIPIACFEAREEMEDMLIRWTQKICEHQESFLVTLNNFSAIPPHIVYIRVQNEAPFQLLASSSVPWKTLCVLKMAERPRSSKSLLSNWGHFQTWRPSKIGFITATSYFMLPSWPVKWFCSNWRTDPGR